MTISFSMSPSQIYYMNIATATTIRFINQEEEAAQKQDSYIILSSALLLFLSSSLFIINSPTLLIDSPHRLPSSPPIITSHHHLPSSPPIITSHHHLHHRLSASTLCVEPLRRTSKSPPLPSHLLWSIFIIVSLSSALTMTSSPHPTLPILWPTLITTSHRRPYSP
ncbi:hypothetical protein FALBO_7380 [Fusarium albosuccineum]|uniref:Uncharacterized protein n=1 Tax=Fusarium albosuccineum TaxID=1237068 RepID=A0A8H4PCI3_9HYPO|nr:hypothetical protein FALBO_7380 [Fusarium albosuccineum]